MQTIAPWIIEEILRREAERNREVQEPLFIYEEPPLERPTEDSVKEEEVERGVCIISLL